MQIHNHNTAMPQPLECEAVLSDLVLQAARAVLPKDSGRWFADTRALNSAGPRNEPLIPLLIGLLDAAKTVAAAMADNAWDDCLPVDRALASDLVRMTQAVADDINNASSASGTKTA